MEFRTRIPIQKREPAIEMHSRIFLLGSCFVENIGKKLAYFGFQHMLNPFGILFHPQAIANFLEKLTENHSYTEKDIFFHSERWHCFEAHSSLSSADKDLLLQKLNLALRNSREFLQSANFVAITLGTAWTYRHLEKDVLVANCHKVPQREFKKSLLSTAEIQAQLERIQQALLSINPELQILFTVSPVRHLKDGFVENQQSKAKLISALHDFLNSTPGDKISYFPAYEIMMDELRDYRFYAEDMIHPSAQAIDYIWERFSESYFSEACRTILPEVDSVRKGLAHRPFDEDSEAHKKFLQKLQQKISKLQERYPHLQF
ncbi:GSCFA domain-containing protein [Salegentibacter sp. HM20]